MARIALIYYLLDLPPEGQSNSPRGFAWRQGVGVKHLDAAMAVWDYCEQSVKQLFGGQHGLQVGFQEGVLVTA